MRSNATCTDPKVGALLAGYEMDLLDSEQRLTFEAHLAACDACLDELFHTAPYTTAMRTASGDVLSRLPSRSDARDVTDTRSAVEQPWWSRFRLPVLVPVAAAAAAAALLLVRPASGPGSLGELAIVEPLPWTTVETRAGELEAERIFQRGMANYARGDYAAAAATLSAAVERGAGDSTWTKLDQARLFLGLSFLLIDDPENGGPHLETAARADSPPLRDRARWYLAQSRLMTGDGGAALVILDALAESPGYGQSARELAARVRARSR